MEKRLYTIAELAAASGYSRQAIHSQVGSGNITPTFVSSSLILIDRAEFEKVVGKAKESGKYRTFKRVSKNSAR